MVVIAIFRVTKAPFIDENLSIIDCYAEAVHVFRNFVHVIKNRLVGAPVHVIEKTVHVHENCCSRVLRILKAEMLNFGIFVLISNRHRDPWQALTHYRRRNDIETSYHMIKSELDGARARCWDMKRVRGKELCRLIALGYRFYLQNALKATRKEAEQLSRDEECGKVERDRMAGAAAWLKKMSLRQFLGWFDCVETVTVRNKRAKSRWSTESTTRDRLVLQMLKENMARSEVEANP